jgi:aminoglycoside phosphotransferase (APT) family kinase protein
VSESKDLLSDADLSRFLRASGLVPNPEQARLTRLTGGVSSDIWKVETPERTFVLKKALARLRVAKEWTAPVSRNANEVDWMLEVASIAPTAVPNVLASDADIGVFAMCYLDPSVHPVWKDQLLRGQVDPAFAKRVGDVLVAIHKATAGSGRAAERFATDDTFRKLRIEPYLEATADVHGDLSRPLLRIAGETMASKRALVHGDVSPKNILAGPHGPVLLDAECAWFGDPAFDLAFCLNHLLLKCVHVPAAANALLASFCALTEGYLGSVDWEERAEIEARAARLLPALLLSRIDGKSPVEYITQDADKNRVREFARSYIKSPPALLQPLGQAWTRHLD